jgi:hypothetical protein
MKSALHVCLLVAVYVAAEASGQAQAPAMSPAYLEVNLAGVAIDWYDGCITNNGTNSCNYVDWVAGTRPVNPGGQDGSDGSTQNLAGCTASTVYRACIQSELAAYAAQGVVGVRFQFAMNGCGNGSYPDCVSRASTPFLDQPNHTGPKAGTLNQVWLNNLNLFFQDLRAANIRYVSFTPDMNGGFSGDSEAIWYCGSGTGSAAGSNWSACAGGNHTDPDPNYRNDQIPDIIFYPWLPWGVRPEIGQSGAYDPTGVYHPYSDPDGYASDPWLPTELGYWGWGPGSPFLAFFDSILAAAMQNQLTVREVDLFPEAAISWSPVVARLIYDPMTTTQVLSVLGAEMPKYGFNSTGVTMSAASYNPLQGLPPCTTTYPMNSSSKDDSALIDASEFIAVETGQAFGVPEYASFANDTRQCNATGFQTDAVPAYTTKVSVTDIHAYPCTESSPQNCNGSSTYSASLAIYSAMASFISNNGLASNTFAVGETDPSSTATSQPTATVADATADGQAFHDSGLATAASAVVIRPWENNGDATLNKPASLSGNSSLPFNAGACTFSPIRAQSVRYTGGQLTIPVTAASNCQWSVGPASGTLNWAQIQSVTVNGNSCVYLGTQGSVCWGVGNGSVTFSFAQNTGTGPITWGVLIGGVSFAIQQDSAYPDVPQPLNPVRNATGVRTTDGLWWTESSPDCTMTVSIADSNNPARWTSFNVTPGLVVYFPAPGVLQPGHTYEWYVAATNAAGYRSTSATNWFTMAQMPASRVGVFRNNQSFLLDYNGNESYDPGPYDWWIPSFTGPGGFVSGDVPVTGDWTGDGHAKVGIYRASTGTWYLDANGNGVYDAGDYTYSFGGIAGDIPVVGDWVGAPGIVEDKDCIGIFRGRASDGSYPTGAFWLLDLNCNGSFENTPTDAFFPFGGLKLDVPVVGKWMGGFTQVGVVRAYAPGGIPQGNPYFWVLDGGAANAGNLPANHQPFNQFAFGGLLGDVFVTGDWYNTGYSFAGVWRGGPWYLDPGYPNDSNLNDHSYNWQYGYGLFFGYGGLSGDLPVVGKW